ncbi:hypothetical protein LQZ18_00980 [Lachnospiraceae bacterium ZAX-1]
MTQIEEMVQKAIEDTELTVAEEIKTPHEVHGEMHGTLREIFSKLV